MRWLGFMVTLISAAACTQPAREASVAQALVGDAGVPDLAWVEFVASGCAATTATSCRGPAPLTVHFGALAPRTVETWRWTFGDGSLASSDAAPVHAYTKPGKYSVTFVATAGGMSAQATKIDFIVVDALPVGAACAQGQCAAGLTCVCGGDAACLGVPGVCSVACAPLCNPGSTCVGFAAGPADWQRSLCAPSCLVDTDCPSGTRCRELPGRSGWTKACWTAGYPLDEGQSCVGTSGAPDGTLCAGGDCAPLGARDLCARVCDGSRPCPSYASCAQMSSGEWRCLVACTADHPCTDDPFLACQASDATGSLGFTVPQSSATFCAPRRCSAPPMPGDCGPDGTCVAGFCALKE